MEFLNFSTVNLTNSSDLGTPENGAVSPAKKAMDILLIIIMVLVMMSMGCSIRLDELRKQLKRPVAVAIGLFSQFIVYPPTVFAFAHVLRLRKWDALGMVLLGTCPGGHISNIITFWCDGNVALSVTMTAMSTAVGIGMMPLNLWIYSRSWTDQATVVPYINIVIALVLIVTPVPFGMFILRKWPKVARLVTRIGSTLGFAIIVVFIIMACIQYPEMFRSSWQLWFAAIFLPVLGLCLGYLLSTITCQPPAFRRTIAIEISSQNVAICITIIVISFPQETKMLILMFPLLFSVFTTVVLALFTLSYRSFKLIKNALEKKRQHNVQFSLDANELTLANGNN